MENLSDFLRRPAAPTTSARRAAALLGGGEAISFEAISFGDLIYDRVRIDPRAIEAFDFVHRANEGDIHGLACWSYHIVGGGSTTSYEGHVNQLQGYVFERIAAHVLRQNTGDEVFFPNSSNNPGFDFLVNGEPVQAKCGLSSSLVTEHLSRYPGVPRVVVNQDLASHFADNDHITTIPGITRDYVRSTTEHSLNSSADMLDLHLAEIVPVLSVVRNAYHLWRGNTDWTALLGNIAADGAGRYTGATVGKVMGASAVLMLGLGGWPAILLPVFTATAGYRGGRMLSDLVKKELLLRGEHDALSKALQWWCLGAARVLSQMMDSAEKVKLRFVAIRDRANASYHAMIDDWLLRMEREQQYRRYHLDRFERNASGSTVFDDGFGLSGACLAAMVAASRAGIIPADLSRERALLTASLTAYQVGLRRRLLRD